MPGFVMVWPKLFYSMRKLELLLVVLKLWLNVISQISLDFHSFILEGLKTRIVVKEWIRRIFAICKFISYFQFIKNVSSSTSRKKLYWNIRIFSYHIPLWIYFLKNYMNANIMNTRIFHFIKYDLNGHNRSLLCLF